MTAGADHPPIDADERRRALDDLDTTLLVEASAGSGKTTLLLGRIVSLVRRGRARLGEIAAITFTEKAAAELRVRLRAELERAGLHEALRELESARIGTIHAFAGALLRERPVEAGVDPGFTVADPLTAGLHLDAAWESWLPVSLAGDDARAVRRAIELGVTLETLRELAVALVDERDRLGGLPEPAPAPEPPADLDRAARDIVARLETLVAERARDPADRAADAVLAMAAWARQTAELPEAERVPALLEDAPLPAKVDRLGARTKWRDAGALQECRDALAGLATRVAAAREVARHNLVAALGRWARGFADAYQARKARAGCLDFHDLLLRARDLVRDHPAVRRDFQARIRVLLVDEFQDTDPLQLEMILLLAEGAPPGSLFIVGDPKQSIYRFRRADIETYEAAKSRIAGTGAVLAIRANFRSDRALLAAVNQVFDGVMLPPDDGAYQPAYVPLEPGPASAAGVPPVVLRLADEGEPPASAADALAAEARGLASYLRREVEARGRFAYGDVALLFRAMTGVSVYEDALREAGVPFRTLGGRHYYDRSEVGWTIAALSAIEDPHDPVALVGALRSPFFGLTDEALLLFRRAGGELCYLREPPADAPPALGAAWALFRELHRDRNAVSPAALVERLYVRTEVLAAYALDPHGDARVANLLKVLDTARALEATGALTFRAFVRWLRARGTARYEEEESVLEGEPAVRLLTIHKAKGLEFPVVVVPDLCRAGHAPPRRILVDRVSGRLALSLGMAGDLPLTSREWSDLEAREARRADAEVLRLLYVALTRAQRRLVLPVPPRVEPGGFFDFLIGVLEGAGETVTVDPARPVPAGAPPPAPGPGLDETLGAWRAARRDLLARGAATAPVLRPSDAGPSAAREGRRLGALVHAALAAIDLARPDEAPAVVAALGARQGAPAELVRTAARLVGQALRAPVLARARRAAWLAREVPVTAEVDGALVEGRIDLLFEEDGALVAVEIKTDGDAGGAADQAALYADALARATGRPVREVLSLAVRP